MKNAYKNKKKWGLIIIIAVMAIATLAMVAICINLGEQLLYTMPAPQEYLVYIPTDVTPDEAEQMVVTLTNYSSARKQAVEAEYWEENSCFYVLLDGHGIYKLKINNPFGYTVEEFVKIGRDDVYCFSFMIKEE